MEIQIAKNSETIALCWEAMHLLRPHLVKEEFVGTVTEMIGSGYTLAYIPDGARMGSPSGERAVAAIGFRELHFLLHGKHIYIDDLTTLPGGRDKGHAGMLSTMSSASRIPWNKRRNARFRTRPSRCPQALSEQGIYDRQSPFLADDGRAMIDCRSFFWYS